MNDSGNEAAEAGTSAPKRAALSRRAVVAAAWSAPIIGLAVAAPSAAASTGGIAAEIQVLNPEGPIIGEDGLAVIVLTVLDSAGAGVDGLVTAAMASSSVGRFDVGVDDSAVTDRLARAVADSSGYITFSVVRVAAGSVEIFIISGSVSISVTVQFA